MDINSSTQAAVSSLQFQQEHANKVNRMALDQIERQGAQAVELVQSTAVPKAPAGGNIGQNINVTA